MKTNKNTKCSIDAHCIPIPEEKSTVQRILGSPIQTNYNYNDDDDDDDDDYGRESMFVMFARLIFLIATLHFPLMLIMMLMLIISTDMHYDDYHDGALFW